MTTTRRNSFSQELLLQLREKTVTAALDDLGLYWKRDLEFVPVKDHSTIRINVGVGSSVVELLVTGPKWYDTRAKKGGGGAIDLTMHLLGVDFVTAVKRLQ